jgi:hypothetical protein
LADNEFKLLAGAVRQFLSVQGILHRQLSRGIHFQSAHGRVVSAHHPGRLAAARHCHGVLGLLMLVFRSTQSINLGRYMIPSSRLSSCARSD